MTATRLLKARVSVQTKLSVQRASADQLISESAWLKRLVAAALRTSAEGDDIISSPAAVVRHGGATGKRSARTARLYVRLRREDRLLLEDRAAARGLAPATYVSVLTRSHLRRLPPLPTEELTALKRAVSELSAIGRNLNQLTRLANQGGGRAGGMARDELAAFLKVCTGLRDHVKSLLKANAASWEQGHG